ncbi:MAG: RDD family protein [Bryobacteraceae bacterium]
MFCLKCGASNPDEATYCNSCGSPLRSSVPSAAGAPAYPLAGLGDRLLAVILDTILLGAIFAVAGMWAAIRWGGVTGAGFSLEGTGAAVAICATLLFGFLYYWLLEGIFGATLGKAILGLSVRRKDGAPCRLSSSLIRNLLRIVDGIGAYLVGFLVAILSSSRQRLGDHVAKTVVVTKPVGRFWRAVLVLAWLAACAGGLIEAYLLHRGAPPSLSTGALRVENFAFLQGENGPPRASSPYGPGDTVYCKYQVRGFSTGKEGKIDLLLEAVLRDPNGLAVYPPWQKQLVQTVEAGRPVDGSFSAGLPRFAPPGGYRIELKVHDKVKTASVEAAPTFQVDGPVVAPAARLEIRDFAMSLSEGGPAVEALVLPGGGTTHMRWKVFGAEAKDGKVNLRVALKVTAPDGKVVLDEPKYVVVDDSFYYRPPAFCLPMSGHVTLPEGFPKGAYTLQFTVNDELAGARIEHAARFELR